MALADQQCIPCRGGVPPLARERVDALLRELDSTEWVELDLEGAEAPEDYVDPDEKSDDDEDEEELAEADEDGRGRGSRDDWDDDDDDDLDDDDDDDDDDDEDYDSDR